MGTDDVAHVTGGGWLPWTLLGVLGGSAALMVLDGLTDLREGGSLGHVAVEGLVALLCAAGVVLILRQLAAAQRHTRQARADAAALGERLAASRAEAARWRAEAEDLMRGLGAAIDAQFARWQLSPAEAEIALLMLKGLSHKEIAALRSVSEATVRQQARSIYRKAGVSGRNELTAFFLEDLMLPSAGG